MYILYATYCILHSLCTGHVGNLTTRLLHLTFFGTMSYEFSDIISMEFHLKLKNPSNRTHQSRGEDDRQSTTSSDIPRDAMQKDSNEISL